MHRPLMLACATVWLLLICACQSSSPTPPVMMACQPPPIPPAWFMEAREANLTLRLLGELSPSPTTAIRD
ncbi:Formylglycine-generating enzyme [Pseudomonas syringae pv. actinidiae]|uniref:Formylglycine-generating enzyme n=1 Tax=Pseudomonas syringae pv. actinidiae TaxID=103796 RepID=A0AAN4TJ02_PSESF|nr:Formylglycine-generating enzyme [Pseudomonas syringae pv. actinidiae]